MRGISLLIASAFISNVVNAATPTKIGFLLYPGYQAIDAFGPLDLLNILSWRTYLNLTILTETLDPVSTRINALPMNRSSSEVEELVIPTHTFANAPPIEVLFVPGGLGNRQPGVISAVNFIRDTYPSLQYLITICTGAGLAARAGVLDGKNATTNKWAFKNTTLLGPNTWWHAHARWVVDGNIWSSSGVSAGIDVTLAWISHIWGEATAIDLADGMEYEWHRDPSWDPFAVKYNLTDVINGVTQPPSSSTTASIASSTTTAPVSSTTSIHITTTTKKTTTKSTTSTKSAKTTTTRRWY